MGGESPTAEDTRLAALKGAGGPAGLAVRQTVRERADLARREAGRLSRPGAGLGA